MVDLASGQVSHGHVDGLFRLSYPPLPVKEGLLPHGIGVSTLITVSTLHVVPSYTHRACTQWWDGDRRRCRGRWLSPSASGCGCHNCHHSAMDPPPPGSQHNRTMMAPCGNGGPSLFRQVQSPPWVKSKPNASTVSLLLLPLASSAVLILTRQRLCWAR